MILSKYIITVGLIFVIFISCNKHDNLKNREDKFFNCYKEDPLISNLVNKCFYWKDHNLHKSKTRRLIGFEYTFGSNDTTVLIRGTLPCINDNEVYYENYTLGNYYLEISKMTKIKLLESVKTSNLDSVSNEHGIKLIKDVALFLQMANEHNLKMIDGTSLNEIIQFYFTNNRALFFNKNDLNSRLIQDLNCIKIADKWYLVNFKK